MALARQASRQAPRLSLELRTQALHIAESYKGTWGASVKKTKMVKDGTPECPVVWAIVGDKFKIRTAGLKEILEVLGERMKEETKVLPWND